MGYVPLRCAVSVDKCTAGVDVCSKAGRRSRKRSRKWGGGGGGGATEAKQRVETFVRINGRRVGRAAHHIGKSPLCSKGRRKEGTIYQTTKKAIQPIMY